MIDPIEIMVFVTAERGEKRYLDQLLSAHGSQQNIGVREVSWDAAWGETLKTVLYKVGPDISQVAMSWVYNLAAMNALWPLTKEVARLGGEAAFLPAAWQSVYAADKQEVWAVPWFVDVRIIYYWRDMLEKAGVDEATAFSTPEHVEETFLRLQAGGLSTPWVVPTGRELPQLMSWIWGSGGELMGPDGKRVLINEPPAMAGIRAYFALHRYMPRLPEEITILRAFQMFGERRVAATMGPPSYYAIMRGRGLSPDVLARLGFAAPPGPPFVGGSNVAVWAHSRHPQAAIDVIHSLLSPQALAKYCEWLGQLPARLEALSMPPFATDPNYRRITEIMRQGRPYPNIPRLGLIEENLADAFGLVWSDILSNPTEPLDVIIYQRLEPVALRLETILRG